MISTHRSIALNSNLLMILKQYHLFAQPPYDFRCVAIWPLSWIKDFY